METDLLVLGEDLVTTAARVVRWAPKSGSFRLSLAAARLLARLSDNGPTRISDLAVAENCSQPTVTNHVKKLESSGLVSRRSDPRDARAWMIELTDLGREELTRMRHSLGESVMPAVAAMSRRDQKALREGIEVMRRLMATEAPGAPVAAPSTASAAVAAASATVATVSRAVAGR